uniref:Aminopeptidase n=1 Tax=Ursus maritimus TaxID=29073 RepID=A0A452TQJ8_URSMA
MAKGFYISKPLGILVIILGVAAMCTIIALSVVYAQEKNKNTGSSTESPTATATTTAATTLDQSKPWNRYRLPKTLIPSSYNVTLRPNLTPNSEGLYIFSGNSTVRFRCNESTNVIIIHSKSLNYTNIEGQRVALRGVGGSQAPAIDSTELVELTEYLVVHLREPLQVNSEYEMDSEFQGELADDLVGFYRSEYVENDVKKVLATTQMQATGARKSFPCFDEPAMKATFNITLIHPTNLVALSNMLPRGPTVPVTGDPNWSITEFETTPIMSTYLLAYIVSEFKNVETRAPSGILIRIWARPGAIDEGHGSYALNVTGPILDFFSAHYDTPYPLNKSDQVALPDFSAGAMENWGLVTYRENALLYDLQSSSTGNQERVVTVIAHELAHQWFGNLVTLEWWNDLWLNEGFASYVEYLGADYAEPTWNLKDLIVLNDVYSVMAIDALVSSHPLSSPADEVNTPAQISEVFDSISYSKGASVLRMLSSFLTEDLFKKGVASYLHTFAYKNTIYLDLWDHLQKVSNGQLSAAILLGWLSPAVSRSCCLSPAGLGVSCCSYLWIVPITSVKNGIQQTDYWLPGTAQVQNDLFKTTNNEWLLLNLNVTGYYLVNYDEDNWRRIQTQLQTDLSVIPVINRAQVIHDTFNLASAQKVPVTLALNSTLFLIGEREYMPWEAALSSLSYFRLMFDRSEVYGPMTNYLRKQVTPLFDYFETITKNWTEHPQTLMEQYSEINAVSTACTYGVPRCKQLVSTLFAEWKKDPQNNPIYPNLRSTIYCNAVAQGGEEEWNFVWEQFRNATLVNEADKLRAALACSNQVWILNRYLSYTLNPDLIRKQDVASTLNSIASNVVGQSLVWDFVQSNWKKLFEDYGTGSFSFSNLIRAATQRFSTEFELQQLEQFKNNNMDVGFGSATRALEQILEKTKANIKWVNENKEVVLTWFTENSS